MTIGKWSPGVSPSEKASPFLSFCFQKKAPQTRSSSAQPSNNVPHFHSIKYFSKFVLDIKIRFGMGPVL